MSLLDDFRELIIHNLRSCKAKFAQSDNTSTLLLKYIQLSDKLAIPKMSFNVNFSKEILAKLSTLGNDSIEAIQDIKHRLENGLDITPYLSKHARSANIPDMLIRNWGIYHAHIAEPLTQSSKYTKRSEHLLFFTFEDNDAYLLDVLPHPKGNFFSTSLLEIIYDNNWKHLLNIIPGATEVHPKLTDQKINCYMKDTIVPVPVRDCVVMPKNMGVASSGDSGLAVRNAKYFMIGLNEWQEWQDQIEYHNSIFGNFSIYSEEFKSLKLIHFDQTYFYVKTIQSCKLIKLRIESLAHEIERVEGAEDFELTYFKPFFCYLHDKGSNEIRKVRTFVN